MPVKSKKIHTATLNNNCPICYTNNGLEITFSELKQESRFISKPAKELEHEMVCHNCNQQIYPVNWTPEIERVYDYQHKLAEREQKSKVVIKPLFYVVMSLGVLLVAMICLYFLRELF